MTKEELFKSSVRMNFRCSLLAMILSQALIFTFEFSIVVNLAAYILNIICWIVVDIVFDAFAATYYDIDLAESKENR
jgi:TctA family transporter